MNEIKLVCFYDQLEAFVKQKTCLITKDGDIGVFTKELVSFSKNMGVYIPEETIDLQVRINFYGVSISGKKIVEPYFEPKDVELTLEERKEKANLAARKFFEKYSIEPEAGVEIRISFSIRENP